MTNRLIIRPEAEAEMAEAFDWYSAQAPGLGDEFMLCLDAVFSAIIRNPQQYPHVHRIVRRALTRRFPYEVLFLDEGDRIVVLSVFHAKRNPKRWQERV